MPKKSGKVLSGGLLPPPEIGGDFDPFLKAEHIGKGKLGDTATLEFTGENSVEMKNEYGARVQCTVRLKGKQYTYGVKLDAGSYGRLYKKWGSNPAKWKGRVNVEVMRHMKKLYVAVV